MPHIVPEKLMFKRVLYSFAIVLLLILILWVIHVYISFINESVRDYGMRPREVIGLLGIFTMPFLHGSWSHIISNTFPLIVLGGALFYFYKEVSWRVLLLIMVFAGTGLWFIGQPGTNHVGASGIVYGLASFHLTGGLIRGNRNLMAFALLVVFLYGGMIWSIFPDFFPGRNISWEGHLSGLISGIVVAFWMRNKGPAPDPITDDDEEDEEDEEDESGNIYDQSFDRHKRGDHFINTNYTNFDRTERDNKKYRVSSNKKFVIKYIIKKQGAINNYSRLLVSRSISLALIVSLLS